MKKSNEKTIHKPHFYFEPINKYHNISFTDIKDFPADEEYFIDILLVNKNRHRITINTGLISFMNRNITFKKQDNEIYQTNSIELFTALYRLTYESEHDISEILNIQENETIEQVATFERKPNFKCKFNINKYSEQEKKIIQMFDFQHSHLTQEEFEKVVTTILQYKQVYATTKFDVGRTKVKLNLPMKKDAIFKKQRISKVPIHLRERIQKLLDILKKYDIIAPVNKEQLSTGNTFTNPVIILRKGESLKIVLDARYLNSMIDESKCNWSIEPVDVALTRINGTIFTTADLNSAYNQIPLDEESMRYTHFTIGNEQYCFKRLFYGISIGPAAFASKLTKFLYPLIRKGTVITYVDDIIIQTNSHEQMFETLIEYHKILLKENLKAAPEKTYFMLKKVKFLGHIIEDKKMKPITSRIDGFQKLEPPTSMKALQRYLGTINFLAKYVYGMQPILQPLYNLLHKENDFKWTKEHQTVFEQMKRTITHKLELTMPDTKKLFYIITDASNTGIGAALLQQHPTEKKMRLISANSLANIHNNYFEINIDRNEYHPISYEKYNTETKTNLIPKYKTKTKNWQSPIVEKDDLIIERNQKGPYTVHHDDEYLRLINNVKQENNYNNAKTTDVFYDEKTKITEDLIRETQIIDPVLHKVKMWKKHNNTPHSVTMDIRGNKGLFIYYRKFKSIVIDEKTGIIKIIIRIHKSTIQRICLPLTLLLCVFYENHCTDTVGHTGLEKQKET